MKTITSKLREFYNGRNVYITGITGFKGAWLALILNELGANVSGFGLRPDKKSLFELNSVEERVNVLYADMTSVRDQGRIEEHIRNTNPDVILHLAAQPLVSVGYDSPYLTYNTNIMGTVLIHEIARHLDKKISMINVTTDKVYKEGGTPRVEDNVLQGFDPYSLSKSCSDMISQSYSEAFQDKMIISTMRAGNVLGGGDFSRDRIVTDYVNAYINDTPLNLRHPNSVRPYQHVIDVVIGYIIQAMKQYDNPHLAGSYNIGPDYHQVTETINVARGLNKYMDKQVKIDLNGASVGHENPLLLLNSNKFRETANWKPEFNSTDKVLEETAEWYNKYANNKDVTKVTNNQIKRSLEYYDYKD